MNDVERDRMIRKLTFLALFMIVLLIGLICNQCQKVNATVITGEKHLGGFSKLMEDANYTYPDGILLLAEVMYHENYSNGETVMYYTGAVVMNRVNSKHFPNTVRDVLYQTNPRQYATTYKFYTEEIPESVYHLACKVAKGTPDVPYNVVYQAMFMQGSGLWKHESTEYFCYE